MTLGLVATKIQDLYYQDFVKDSDFFEIEDFITFTSIGYSAVLQEDFDKSRMINIRTGHSVEPQISLEWYSKTTVDIEKVNDSYVGKLGNIFSFRNDISMMGIKNVYPTNPNMDCNSFAKTSIERCSSMKFLPKSDKTIYYYILLDKIYFINVKCGIKSVDIVRIPSYVENGNADDINIPDTFIENIITRTLALIKQSADKVVIDKTEDQNPNKVIQTEINT